MESQGRTSSEQKRLRKNAVMALSSLEDEDVRGLAMSCAEDVFITHVSISAVMEEGCEIVDDKMEESYVLLLKELCELVNDDVSKIMEDLMSVIEVDEIRNAVLCAAADSIKGLKLRHTLRGPYMQDLFILDYFMYQIHQKLSDLRFKLKNPNEKLHKGKSFVEFIDSLEDKFNSDEPDYKIARAVAEASDRGRMVSASGIAHRLGIDVRGSNLVAGRLKHLRRIFPIYGVEIVKVPGEKDHGKIPMFYRFER